MFDKLAFLAEEMDLDYIHHHSMLYCTGVA